jgi:PD-(D/E)XK nuclease superfamily
MYKGANSFSQRAATAKHIGSLAVIVSDNDELKDSDVGAPLNIESALSDLIDDNDFIAPNKRRAHFNLFEALGAIRGELRHSNFLAFILSPARSHRLGTKPLQVFLRALLAKLPTERRPIRALEVAVGDLDDAAVFREVDYIDLLIEIRELNLVVVIENKVDAKAGEGQLARYKA